MNIGATKFLLEDFQGAIDSYSLAINLNPSFADAYFKRGFARIKLGQKQGACADFDKAKKLGNPSAEDALNKNCN
jgi:tetratricopeptide (TPR) repeat protein